MARGVGMQSSQAAIEHLLPKRRMRTRVALKPTAVNLSDAKEVNTQRWTNVPRTIRPRIERARAPQSKGSKALKAQAPEPNQALARNGSGNVALGPWVGPFGTQTSTEDIAVVYVDRMGSGHLSLDDLEEGDGLEGLAGIAGFKESTNALSPTHRRLVSVMPKTPRSQRAHTMEVAALQSKPYANWSPKAITRVQKKGLFHGRVGAINQPRRGY